MKVFLKSGKEEPVRRFHPWVFSGAIARIEGKPKDGDIVEVCDKTGLVLGVGHFHHGSIAVRILSFEPTDISQPEFWIGRLRNAWASRQTSLRVDMRPGLDCFRLVHGEGDGLSGLIIDVYAKVAVLQCHSIGMYLQRKLIAAALSEVLKEHIHAIYDKSVESLPQNFAQNYQNEYLWTSVEMSENSSIVTENDVKFRVNWETGQKTGFFLDQRDNRQLLASFSAGKSVLNTFCYSGGFSCYALKAGATLVHSVDSSGKAMELTDENVALNGQFEAKHESHTEDVLRFLKNTEQQYDIVVVDPPAYAKTIDKRHNAVQGYKRLNESAIHRVAPGGLLFTFSCSQVVDRNLFYHTIVAAALEAGRPARVIHHLTQGADHPVSLFHPEGSYLKGLVLEIG